MTTNFTPLTGGTISDPDSGTAADRKLDTTGITGFAYVMIANATTGVAYLVSEDDATTGGRSISAGGSAVYGPYASGTDLWVYGEGTGSVHYDFDQVQSEG